jgi:hypothetical protein
LTLPALTTKIHQTIPQSITTIMVAAADVMDTDKGTCSIGQIPPVRQYRESSNYFIRLHRLQRDE